MSSSKPICSFSMIERVRMQRAANGLAVILEASLPMGCFEWIASCRPDIARYLSEADVAPTLASDATDPAELVRAVKYSSGLYERVAWIARLESGCSQRRTNVESR